MSYAAPTITELGTIADVTGNQKDKKDKKDKKGDDSGLPRFSL